jgi:hypothetical protein
MAVTRLTTNGLTGTKYDIASADNYYMEPIATNLLSSATATVTFSNIPQGYKHLQIRFISRNTVVGDQLGMQFNLDGGSNYARHELSGFGSSANSYASTSQIQIIGVGFEAYSSNAADIFGAGVIDILDYNNTNKYKTVRSFTGYDFNGGGGVGLVSGLWMNTAPIASITMNQQSSGNFAINSRFSLYGIKG